MPYTHADAASMSEMDGFSLGEPVLVCRWRLAGTNLPMANRHLRALGRRTINGDPLPNNLVNWAKQHIEWTLDTGASVAPNGVLMLLVDDELHAAMTVGPYEPLANASVGSLLERADNAAREADETGVAPEVIWAVRNGDLVCGLDAADASSGATSLIHDLAATLGLRVTRDPLLRQELASNNTFADEVFLTSDEHGIVPASDHAAEMSDKLAQGYERLLTQTARKRP